MKNRVVIGGSFILLFISTVPASGQGEKQHDTINAKRVSLNFDDQIEKSAEALELDHDYSDLVEDIIDLTAKPVNLNNAKEDELNSIPFLTPAQRKDLFNFVTTYGEVLSIYELQSIPGFDTVLIQNIRPFISISPPSHTPPPTPKNLCRFGHHDLLMRYEQAFPKSSGYLAGGSVRAANPDAYYPGDPRRYYFRYNYSWFDKLKIGLAGEKDPGEQFFQGAQSTGMDFYAFYLCLTNIGILKNLTIGNFRVSYGQGLTMGSGLSLGSVPGFPTNIPMANGIRPSLGMSEGSYLRGLAATIKIKRIEISGFASFHPRDGTVCSIDSNSTLADGISSFSGTGYHRTGLELSKRNTLTELVCGGNMNIVIAPNQQFGFKIGLTGIFSRYSAAVTPTIYPYNQFMFHGNQNLNAGLDVQIRYRGLYLFSEMGRSLNNGMAWLAGTILSPDPRVCITLICRNYQPGFQNLYANAFGQNSLNTNEQGVYAAINAAVHPKLSLSGYIDLFTFPWLKYRVDSPTSGQEFGMMLGWQAPGDVIMQFRVYQKNTRGNSPAESGTIIHKLCNNLIRSYRFGLEWPAPGNRILFKTRIDVKEASESGAIHTYGYLVYEEVQIKSLKRMENITLRFALFDVPDYAARIYAYEPEVLYGYSVPAYQGKGLRTCLVVKSGITRKIDLWVRGGITYYTDREEVGTGLDLTAGNIRAELTGQLLIRF
jgi:hypothetical protein